MPTYDYQCDQCGHIFETIQAMRDDPLKDCPECHTPALRRLITGGTGVIFRGSGFYVTDSKKGAASAGRSNGSATEEKTDTAQSETNAGDTRKGEAGTGEASSAETGTSATSKAETKADDASKKEKKPREKHSPEKRSA